MLLFALDAHDAGFAQAVAADLDVAIAPHEHRVFEDGERKLRPLVDPRGSDAYVLLGLHGGPVESPHDKLLALLMFIDTLHGHGARRVSAVVPYLAYARKDRQTQPHDPVGLRTIAELFEAVDTSQLIVLEAHNPAALQNAFRIPTLHLEAHHAFLPALDDAFGDAPVVVASPDPGGVKRAQLWREALQARLARPVGFAMIDKRRSAGVVSGGDLVAGEVQGAQVVLVDDLIASGETLHRAASALRRAGAAGVVAAAAHGLFVSHASQTLLDPQIDRVMVTDSVPAFRADERLRARLQVHSCAPLFAQAIRESHASWSR